MKHRDLWEEILTVTEALGDEVKWLHTPSHVDISGNTRADHLADVGRRKSPGQIHFFIFRGRFYALNNLDG